MPLDTYAAAGGSPQDQFVYVTVAPGADSGAVRIALQGVLAAYTGGGAVQDSPWSPVQGDYSGTTRKTGWSAAMASNAATG